MLASQVLDLEKWIPEDKIPEGDKLKCSRILTRALQGINPDSQEAKFMNELYRKTQDGDGRESQPFKAYRRPKSKGI